MRKLTRLRDNKSILDKDEEWININRKGEKK